MKKTVAGVRKLLKAHVKNIFSMGYLVNMRRKNVSLVTKDMECNVNARTISYCIIFMFYVIFIISVKY